MGLCDRTTGLCTCKQGFLGAACDIRDCVRSTTTGDIGATETVSLSHVFQESLAADMVRVSVQLLSSLSTVCRMEMPLSPRS